ncbi:hypothetical protein [Pseudomonas syringae]|uniref:hypothetical protein n=1 Tax=Pseudomonas syringae TaxID=317 RepID=UPI0034D49AEA
MHVRNDDQPYCSATNVMKAWPETAEVFGAISHGPGRLRPAVTGRSRPELPIAKGSNRPLAAPHKRPPPASSCRSQRAAIDP